MYYEIDYVLYWIHIPINNVGTNIILMLPLLDLQIDIP